MSEAMPMRSKKSLLFLKGRSFQSGDFFLSEKEKFKTKIHPFDRSDSNVLVSELYSSYSVFLHIKYWLSFD
jgi:hypothetical protein